jgi:hypothetical protein
MTWLNLCFLKDPKIESGLWVGRSKEWLLEDKLSGYYNNGDKRWW